MQNFKHLTLSSFRLIPTLFCRVSKFNSPLQLPVSCPKSHTKPWVCPDGGAYLVDRWSGYAQRRTNAAVKVICLQRIKSVVVTYRRCFSMVLARMSRSVIRKDNYDHKIILILLKTTRYSLVDGIVRVH